MEYNEEMVKRAQTSYRAKQWWIPYSWLNPQPDPEMTSIWTAFRPTKDGYKYYKDLFFGYSYKYDCKNNSWEVIPAIPKGWWER